MAWLLLRVCASRIRDGIWYEDEIVLYLRRLSRLRLLIHSKIVAEVKNPTIFFLTREGPLVLKYTCCA